MRIGLMCGLTEVLKDIVHAVLIDGTTDMTASQEILFNERTRLQVP